MATHLSINTALDKNLLASANTYLMLMEIDVIDANTGNVIETLYGVYNNENFVWNGNTYIPVAMEVNLEQDSQSAPTCTLTIYDTTRTYQAFLQAYGWQLAWPLRIKIVNATNPTVTPEIEQDFEILSASSKDSDYSIVFQIGAENPLALRFPPRQQYPERCFWKYKDSRCQYTGTLPTCDYTYSGANGCKFHNNTQNYGGFPGLRQATSGGQSA